jgi:hypothetical protein
MRCFVIVVATWMSASLLALAAAPPDRLHYQGVLRDAADNPLTGTYAMQFTFYDAAAGGSALLSDLQNAPGVAATGGLFTASLGLNPQGGFPYTSLAAMFADHGTVFLEIKVGAETLSPRIPIRSAPYALNSDAVDGFSALEFGLVGAANTWQATNTFGAGLHANGSIRVDHDGPDGAQSIFFFEGGSPTGRSLTWDDVDNRFECNDSFATLGALRIGSLTAAPTAYSVIGSGTALATAFTTSSNDLLVSDDLEVVSSLVVGNDIRMNEDGPDGNQVIRFYNAGAPASEAIYWDDGDDQFVISDTLAVDLLNSLGDVEANGNLYVNQDGPDADSRIYFFDSASRTNESIGWFDSSDYFNISDDVNITNDLSVAGTKNFVQNHPERSEFSIVYTALEGDEAGTYTRGTARLENGTVRVPLGETFALVTNPDIGLTAHVTPRGGAASLWVESLTTREMVVRGSPDDPSDQRFDYVVMGLRVGFERHPVIQARRGDAALPDRGHWDRRLSEGGGVPRSDSLGRFEAMMARAGIAVPEESEAARALRRAIGERDPEAPETLEPSWNDIPSSEVSIAVETTGSTRESHLDARPSRSHEARSGDPAATVPFVGSRLQAVDVAEPVEFGDALTLDPFDPGRFRRATEWADPGVVGVVAGDPFVEEGRARVSLATSGIHLARAEALRTPITAGDLLVASTLAGHLAKADEARPGTIVAKALEALASGSGTIRVLVMLR